MVQGGPCAAQLFPLERIVWEQQPSAPPGLSPQPRPPSTSPHVLFPQTSPFSEMMPSSQCGSGTEAAAPFAMVSRGTSTQQWWPRHPCRTPQPPCRSHPRRQHMVVLSGLTLCLQKEGQGPVSKPHATKQSCPRLCSYFAASMSSREVPSVGRENAKTAATAQTTAAVAGEALRMNVRHLMATKSEARRVRQNVAGRSRESELPLT